MVELESITKKNVINKEEGERIKYPTDKIFSKESPIDAISFAEQYLEKPVAYGKYATQNGMSVTFCTFRGIPLLDDY